MKNEEIKMHREINETLRKYERQILKSVCEFLRNSVEPQATQQKVLTKTCTQLLLQKDADIKVDWCSGRIEIEKIEKQYADTDHISRHKKQIFAFDKKQMIELYKEYVTKHPDREPKTYQQRCEFSFLQVQIPVFEAFLEYKWKTKRAYEIELEVECTKTLILVEVMELSKFFVDLNYINEEICGLFYTSIRNIGNLESYVTRLSDSVENTKNRENAKNWANETKEKLMAAKQLAGHKPSLNCKIGTQNIYYVDVLN